MVPWDFYMSALKRQMRIPVTMPPLWDGRELQWPYLSFVGSEWTGQDLHDQPLFRSQSVQSICSLGPIAVGWPMELVKYSQHDILLRDGQLERGCMGSGPDHRRDALCRVCLDPSTHQGGELFASNSDSEARTALLPRAQMVRVLPDLVAEDDT